jgi:hypothetical protein
MHVSASGAGTVWAKYVVRGRHRASTVPAVSVLDVTGEFHAWPFMAQSSTRCAGVGALPGGRVDLLVLGPSHLTTRSTFHACYVGA